MKRKSIVVMGLVAGSLAGSGGVEAEKRGATAPLPAGNYECKVSSEYRFRPCTVSPGEDGRMVLEVPEGGLVGFTGTISKKGAWILIEGRLNEKRPFGCYACQERCSVDPSACVCQEIAAEHSATCLAQPIYVLLKPAGSGKWSGIMPYWTYTTGVETDLFEVAIRKAKR